MTWIPVEEPRPRHWERGPRNCRVRVRFGDGSSGYLCRETDTANLTEAEALDLIERLKTDADIHIEYESESETNVNP